MANHAKTITQCIPRIFPICYIVMIVLGAFIQRNIEQWSSMVQADLTLVSLLIISSGSLGLIFTIISCFYRSNTQYYDCWAVIYFLVFNLQLAAVVYGCMQVADDKYLLKETINADMKNKFGNSEFLLTFHQLQIQQSCCGVSGVEDYEELGRQLPMSCCDVSAQMIENCTASLAYKDGCASKMYNDIIYGISVLSYTTMGLLIFSGGR